MSEKYQKDRITIDIAQRIIKESVKNQIVFNIIDQKDLKQMWDKLKNIQIKIG